MKLLLVIILVLMSAGIAEATYINDQAFGLGNGAYITVNTTTIDDVNQLACCDNNELMMRINGSMTNYTAGVNKTLTSVTFNNVTDNFTIPVSGAAGYLNFSAIMANASNSYNLTANGAFVESRNTTADGKVWFNYTGDATLSVTWNSSTSGAEPPVVNGSPTITSNLNNHTNNADTSFTADINEVILFSAGANQSLTWTWTGATEGAGDGTANSTATKQFTSAGVQYVNVSGTNANGSTSLLSWTVTVSTEGGGGGTNWDYLTGTCSPNGATISTSPNVGSATCTAGAYSFGYVFNRAASPYWINVSYAGYTSNNSQVVFNEDHEIWNVVLTAIAAPTITSLNNSNTNTSATTISVALGESVVFSAGANQNITTWTWGGAAYISGNGLTNSTASHTFSNAGSTSVTVYGTNTNGTSTTSTWTVNVAAAPINPYNYTVEYQYNCDQARGGGVSFEFMKLFNAITLFIIVILLIFIIKMVQENLIVGILSTVIIIIFVGTLLPGIAGWSTEVACVDWSESHNISGKENLWIDLAHSNIKSASETVSNSTYTGVLDVDYNMNYVTGKFKPLSTGGLNFGS